MVTGTTPFSSSITAESGTSVLAGIAERGDVGIDRHQPVLAARFDAVAGIVEEGDVGAFGILDEALEVALQLPGVAVADAARIEAEVGQQLDHLARVVGGIGERARCAHISTGR